jgi:hypothetical protein
VDVISFGRDREPRHWLPDPWRRTWLGLVRRLRRRAGLVIVTVVLAGVAAVLVLARGHAHHVVTAAVPAILAQQPPVLFGVRARSVRTDLVLGGDNIWRLDTGRPRQVLSAVLANGLSPLLANSGAGVRAIDAVAGGVIALIADPSAPGVDGTRGAVVFIPWQAPARVIAKASAIAVAPGGRAVWVQTAVSYTTPASPKTIWSPTYAVSLAGRRISAVLRLPLGLAAATSAGLLTDDAEITQLALWNAATGSREQLRVPPGAAVLADGNGVVIWQDQPCPAGSPAQLTDLRDGSGATIAMPAGWSPLLYQEPVSFDQSGTRLVLPLEGTDASGNPIAEDLYLVDMATRTVRAIPGGPSASDQPLGLGTPGSSSPGHGTSGGYCGCWPHPGTATSSSDTGQDTGRCTCSRQPREPRQRLRHQTSRAPFPETTAPRRSPDSGTRKELHRPGAPITRFGTPPRSRCWSGRRSSTPAPPPSGRSSWGASFVLTAGS